MKKIRTIKIASSIEPPPLMVDIVFDLVDERIENAIESGEYVDLDVNVPIDLSGWKYEFIGGKPIKELIETNIKRNVDKNIEFLQLQSEESGISFDQKDLSETKEMMLEKRSKKFSNIKVKAKQIDESEAASWHDDSMTLEIYLPEDLESIDQKYLESAIIHELRHFSQAYLSLAIYGEFNRSVGTTSYNTPKFDQNSEEDEYSVHAMDDYEFYPELGGVILDSAEIIRNYYSSPESKIPLNDMINMIIEDNYFFQALAQHPEAQGKLKKAKSEFYKAMLSVFEDVKQKK
jgi:hypothetical protein